MKTIKRFSIFIFIILMTLSCKKNDEMTDLDKIELELKAFVADNNLTKCSIREFQNGTWEDFITESSFSFSNGFILVNKVYPTVTLELRYNLINLYSFRNSDGILFMEFIK